MARILADIFPGGIKLKDLESTMPPPLPPDQQLRVAMSDAGITPPDDVILDGKLRRFSTSGKRGDDSGWYVGWDDGKGPAAGSFGDWRQGNEVTWRADIGREMSAVEQMMHAARMREAKQIRERELAEARQSAAETAAAIWEAAPIASDDHPYLVKKGITNPGLRVATDGRLIAPMYSGDALASLQFIAADGSKKFLKGGKAAGAWWLIGSLDNARGRVYVAEGVATAESIHAATGRPVAIAYSAGNMTATATALRGVVGPVMPMVVVADNDESGTGQREGQRAADAVGGVCMVSPYGDANDFAQEGGDLLEWLEGGMKAEDQTANVQQSRYKLVPARLMTNLPAARWIIKSILPMRDVCAIYGPPGAGKSFMALDMAVHIAEGKPWMGYRTKQATVVYLVLEAAGGFSGRLKAWQDHHGRELPDNFHVITGAPFAFSSAGDIRDLIESIRIAVGPQENMVLYVDTLARAMGLFEENDNGDMGRVVAACDVMARELDSTVVTVAHPGKDSGKGLRGGSALLGGLDTVIALEKNDAGLRTWKIEKQKEGVDGITGGFSLHVVTIGTDEDGDDITSAVVIPADGSEMESNQFAIKENKELAKCRRHFENAVRAFGRIDRRLNAPFITTDAWKDFIATQEHGSDAARRTYMSKAKKVLVDAGYIEPVVGGYVATDHPALLGAFIGMGE